jgi:hypothetical protein
VGSSPIASTNQTKQSPLMCQGLGDDVSGHQKTPRVLLEIVWGISRIPPGRPSDASKCGFPARETVEGSMPLVMHQCAQSCSIVLWPTERCVGMGP